MKIYYILFLAVLMVSASSSILFAQVENSIEGESTCSLSMKNDSDISEESLLAVEKTPDPVLTGGPIGFTMEAARWLMNRTVIRSLTGLGRTVEATGNTARIGQAASITTNSKIEALIRKKAVNNRLIDVKKRFFATIPSAGEVGSNRSYSASEESTHSLSSSAECIPTNHQSDPSNINQPINQPPTSHLPPPTTIRSTGRIVTEEASSEYWEQGAKSQAAGEAELASLWKQVAEEAEKAKQLFQQSQEQYTQESQYDLGKSISSKNVADATLKSAKVIAKSLEWRVRERESINDENVEEADLWQKAARGAGEASLRYQQAADQYAVEKGDKGISLENKELSELEQQAHSIFMLAKDMAIRAEKFSFESSTNSSKASPETPKLMMEPQEVAEGLESLRIASVKRISRLGTARTGEGVENSNTIFVSSSSNNTTGFSIKPKNSSFEVSETAKSFVTSVVDQVFHMPSTEASSKSMDVVQQELISHGIVSAKRAEFTMKEAICYTVEQYRKSIVNIREEEPYLYADELSREIAANEFEHRISLFIPKYIKRERSAFVRARSDWKPFSKAMKNFRKNPNKANFELADQARMEAWKAVTNLAVVSAALADIYWTGYESFGETYYQTDMGYCCDMELDQLKRTMQEDARAIQDLALATFAAADATATSEADIADRGAVSRCSMAKFTDAMDSARWTNHYDVKIINDTWREEMQWVADAAQKVADFVSNDHYQIYNTPET